jgi:hypothetical protein
MSWWDDNGFTKPKTGSPVPGVSGWVYDADGNPRKVGAVASPGFVYNQYGGVDPVDGTPNGEGETTAPNGVSTPTTPATTNTTTTTTTTTKPTGNKQADVTAILQKYPHTPAGLAQAMPEIQKLYPNAKIAGSKSSKIDFGDGTPIVQVVQSAGLGGTAWTWDTGQSAGGGLSSLLGSGGNDPFGYAQGSLLTPFLEEYKNKYGDAPVFTPPDAEKLTPWQAPAPYVAPTGDEVKANDPGYAFGLKEGEGALENSAAARRYLNTGSTLKDVLKYGNDYATTKYNDAVARGQSIYSLNTSTGLNANQAANSAVQTNNNNTFDRAKAGADSTRSGYDTNVANSFASFLQRYNQFNTNKKMQYDMLTGVAGLGA